MKPVSFWSQVLMFLSLISGALLVTAPDARALVIDDFTQGALVQQATNFTGKTTVQTGLNPALVLGGARSVYVGSLQLAEESIELIKGRFHFTANQNYGYFKLDWGSVNPLNVDLTTGGNNRFRFELVDTAPSLPDAIFQLRVMSGNNWFTTEIRTDLKLALNGQSFGVMDIPFTRFAGANFAVVQAIELEAARVSSLFHLAIDSSTAVPEPSGMALLGIATGTSLLTRRSLRRIVDVPGTRAKKATPAPAPTPT